jgi:sterol desaturase/sphingolipid hydroxylase (fatty acid hydroxylase superfamily)
MYRMTIRFLSYPLVMTGVAVSLAMLWKNGESLWPGATIVALLGACTVAGLEWLLPYEERWLHSNADLWTDLLHNVVNLVLIQIVSYWLFLWTPFAPWHAWPSDWPLIIQLALVAVIVDFSLYVMHRVSHRVAWLWRLHAIHHSAERLYWFNGERRHPLHAMLLAFPGLAALAFLTVPQELVTIWFTILTVHLAFQHSNLDYDVGPLSRWLGVASMHRWHHKRDFEDAQVNFGEFLLVWDRLFGTLYAATAPIKSDEVGLQDRAFPKTYWRQLTWPFKALQGRNR